MKRSHGVALAAVLAFSLAVLAHVESLGYWFTSYDSIALVETSRIASLADLRTIFTKPLLYGTSYLDAGRFYRPVVNLVYAAEYALWGVDPFGYHLTNLLLHGFVSVLVVLTIRSLTDSLRVGTFTGALFAIHPLGTDVVPAISRRQDMLLALFGLLALWLFVESVRRDSRRLRVGSAVAYGLALFSKETAAVVGPLAFLWLVLEGPSLRQRSTYRRAIVAVAPLAAVAVGYLAVRFAVLGGIGGYTHDPPLSQTLLFPVQYVLSLVYQADVLAAISGVSTPLVIAVVTAVPLALLVSFARDRTLGRIAPRRALPLVVAIVGFAVLLVVARFPGASPLASVDAIDHAGWYTAGIVFAVGAASALLAAIASARSFTAGRSMGFFFLWLLSPLPLFFLAKQFAFRDAYFFAIPLLALAAVCLDAALPAVDGWRTFSNRDTDALVVVAVLVLLVPSLAASPLLYADSGWGETGDVTRSALDEIDRSVSEVDAGTPVAIAGVPTKIDYRPQRLGRAHKVTMLQPHSVRSWLRLQGHDNRVTFGRLQSFHSVPGTVSTKTRENERLLIWLRYD
ncbi:glycosyltransferase family 39 protein [Halococcus thailandensis]|uniref:Membrane protein n=1 Tax=Halococcus thailandensis JCM 13552 TaxID=1227457 RepID=M0MWY7_9EURY|nr:glycosyltransferase family 39 protein [Halococcus thailandensis]EMA50252.1 membrane protein [Halococcus thailandensis JCM 13552]